MKQKLLTLAELRREKRQSIAAAARHYKLDEKSFRDLAVQHFMQQLAGLPQMTLHPDGHLEIGAAWTASRN